MKNLTRRDFIRLCGTSSIGLALAACGVTSTLAPTPTATPAPTNAALPTTTVLSTTPTTMPTTIPTVLLTATAAREPTFAVAGLGLDQCPPARLASEVIAQYAKAVNLKPETIALKSLQMKDQQGRLLVVAATMDSTPLLMAEQKVGSGELLWQVVTEKRLAETRSLLIGSFFGANNVTPNDYNRIVDILKREFNFGAIYLDMARVQPQAGKFINIEQDVYEFRLMKQLKDQMAFYFHSLIWFRNAPIWMRNLQKAELVNAIQDHSATIAAIIDKNSDSTKPPVISVVNEAYDNGDFLRDKIGEEYVDIAFQAARKAAPTAMLIYNDYSNHILPGTWEGARYDSTKRIVERLKGKGLIDGVGLQMHLYASSAPSKEQLTTAMRGYGVPVYITEFDVNMMNMNKTSGERNQIQAEIYRIVTEAAIESGVCKGMIDFQLGDKFSYAENVTTFSGYSKEADPTPFDDDLNPKPAFFAQRKAFLTASNGN